MGRFWSVLQAQADDLISLVYPRLCLACRQPLLRNEKHLCMLCRYELPETGYHKDTGNRVARHFWGRVRLEAAASLYTFGSGSKVQKLIHALKYENRPEIGDMLGAYYGLQLRRSAPYSTARLIVPVPLHPLKEHRRGYNQAARFARGLSETMGIRAGTRALERISFTETQTRKNREQRWENVRSVFRVKDAGQIRDTRILLVDDVVTTGSTLEACARALLDAGARGVMVATIACAAHL